MAWLAVNINGTEMISERKPHRETDGFWSYTGGDIIRLPIGTIVKIIDKVLTWDDEPVEI